MKIKYLIIVSLILAIITIGAASASQDIASDDGLAASDGDDQVSIDNDDSLSEEGDDLDDGEDDWNDNSDESDFIDINQEVAINDENDYFAEVELDATAQGNISVSVDGNKVYDKNLDQIKWENGTIWNNDDELVQDESVHVYKLYLTDLDYTFEAGNSYDFNVSYFDGENTYYSTETVSIYKKDIITQDGITIEIDSQNKCYIDEESYFIDITAPISADGNVTVVIYDGDSVKYTRTLKLSEIEERYLDEEDETCSYQISAKEIDEEFEIGTYDVEVTYAQDGIEDITLTGTVIFTSMAEEENPYKGYLNQNEVQIENTEETLISVFCPEGTEGKFVINIRDDEYVTINSVEHNITVDDYGKTISWNIESLGITAVGNYQVEVYYYGTEEYDHDYVTGGTLHIVDDTQFRVKSSYAILNDFGEVFFVFCPEGSEGKKITLNVTDYDGVIKTLNYTVRSEDTGDYKGFTLDELGITTARYYYIDVLIDDEILSEKNQLKVSSPFYILENVKTNEEEYVASVEVPKGITEGKIILKIGEYTFEKELSQFTEDEINDMMDEYNTYEIYYGNLTEEITPGTYTVTLTFIGEKEISETKEVLFYKDNKVVDEESGVSIEIMHDSYEFVDVLVPYSVHEGNISILVDGEEELNIDLATYEGYIWDDSGYNIYRFNFNNLKSQFKGTHEVKVIYYLNDEEVISTQDNVKFSDEVELEDSQLTFDDELGFPEGTTGTVGFTVVGATVEEQNIIVENHPEAVISLNGNEISISGLSAGEYTLKVTTTPDENHNAVTEELSFTVLSNTPAKIDPKFTVSVADVEVGNPITVNVTAVEGFNGVVTVKIDGKDVLVNVVNGVGSNTTDLGLAVKDGYTAVLEFVGTDDYLDGRAEATFNVTAKPKVDPAFTVSVADVEVGNPITVNVTVVEGFNGVVTVRVNDIDVLVNVVNGAGSNTTDLGLAVKDGYTAVLNFAETDDYHAGHAEATFNVTAKPVPVPVDPALELIIANVEEGTPVTITVKTNATFTGQVKISSDVFNTTVEVKNGEGQTTANLAKGTYSFKAIFNATDAFKASEVTTSFNVTEKSSSGNGSGDNKTNTTVPVKIVANDLSVFYNDGKKYTVTVYGTDGKPAVKTQVVFKINGKKVGSAVTDAKGVATLKITQVPKTYKITAEALGASIIKTLKVKQVLKLQKVKVKRSAKKLVIKVTLKQGKKALGKKKITLKFKGKKYVKKTNKKGVAKFTIKKSVLKKLKKGKKVTYSATYLKDTVKRTVKVKK